MQIFAPTGLETAPTDRNPSTVAVGGAASATAGQDNQVATYSVPSGRRAIVSVQSAGVVSTAMAAGQTGSNRQLVTPNGGAANQVYDAETGAAAPVGTRADTPSTRLELKTVDQVQIRVIAGAGAGVIVVKGGIHGVEYDA